MIATVDRLIATSADAGDGIFRTIEQALHVAFLFEILPATQKSQMQALIEKLQEHLGVVNRREAGTLNFGGMNALEIRGQCAMIRAAVDSKLMEPEANAIKARYGQHTTKCNAMLQVAQYINPLISQTSASADAAQSIVCSIYAQKKEKPFFTTRVIAERHKVSQRTICNDIQIAKRHTEALENSAVARLMGLL